MSAQVGEESIKAFAESRANDIVKKASLSLVKKSHKSDALASFLSEQGYAASVVVKAHGEEICQHHCPIAHVAAEFPQLCEAETRAFSELLGTHVQRLATIAHGDGVCTTFVPKIARSVTTKRGRS
jgi:predicted ArsR family transcriptional regulator